MPKHWREEFEEKFYTEKWDCDRFGHVTEMIFWDCSDEAFEERPKEILNGLEDFIAKVERDTIQRVAKELIGKDEFEDHIPLVTDDLGEGDVASGRNKLRAEMRTRAEQLIKVVE